MTQRKHVQLVSQISYNFNKVCCLWFNWLIIVEKWRYFLIQSSSSNTRIINVLGIFLSSTCILSKFFPNWFMLRRFPVSSTLVIFRMEIQSFSTWTNANWSFSKAFNILLITSNSSSETVTKSSFPIMGSTELFSLFCNNFTPSKYPIKMSMLLLIMFMSGTSGHQRFIHFPFSGPMPSFSNPFLYSVAAAISFLNTCCKEQ